MRWGCWVSCGPWGGLAQTHGYSSQADALGLYSRYNRRPVRAPGYDDPVFADWLYGYLVEHSVRALIPTEALLLALRPRIDDARAKGEEQRFGRMSARTGARPSTLCDHRRNPCCFRAHRTGRRGCSTRVETGGRVPPSSSPAFRSQPAPGTARAARRPQRGSALHNQYRNLHGDAASGATRACSKTRTRRRMRKPPGMF